VAAVASASPASAATTAATRHVPAAGGNVVLDASVRDVSNGVSRHVPFRAGQSWISMSRSQYRNARTIVRQALEKGMGERAAVIAVATAMQESKLVNVHYGTGDSLGLFQQQPDCGWGSARQVMNPVYSSNAFLNALRRYQESHPGWAHQPLWQAAQGVQRSAYPRAYAQWQRQAAHIVKRVIRELNY
jgi:hypothetical protein